MNSHIHEGVLRECQRPQGGGGEQPKPGELGALAATATGIALVTNGLIRTIAVIAAALLFFWGLGLLLWRS